MRVFKDSKHIYIIPALLVSYDRYYEWDLIYVNIEIRWLNYVISIPIKKEDL